MKTSPLVQSPREKHFNIRTGELIKGILPFLIALIFFLALMVAFPDLSLWLPSMMINR